MNSYALHHLAALEHEAIHILREVAAEFKNPVLMYSVGKDSSVLLHLAQKAFYPGPVPFPLLHINTTFKFGAMIEFRNQVTARHELRLIEWINRDALHAGVDPFAPDSERYTRLMKTEALKAAQPELARGVARGVLHKNTAARKLSRLTKRVASL